MVIDSLYDDENILDEDEYYEEINNDRHRSSYELGVQDDYSVGVINSSSDQERFAFGGDRGKVAGLAEKIDEMTYGNGDDDEYDKEDLIYNDTNEQYNSQEHDGVAYPSQPMPHYYQEQIIQEKHDRNNNNGDKYEEETIQHYEQNQRVYAFSYAESRYSEQSGYQEQRIECQSPMRINGDCSNYEVNTGYVDSRSYLEDGGGDEGSGGFFEDDGDHYDSDGGCCGSDGRYYESDGGDYEDAYSVESYD
ncbi:hypothetical protein V8C37DRAFT_369581 [Trichoderma ceciliae]